MKVFLSYAAEDRVLPDQIQLALLGEGHEVSFDRDCLPLGQDYHARIRTAIRSCDVFVFLLSAAAVEPRSYALTELRHARERWRHPKNHVLLVQAGPFDWSKAPPYLGEATALKVEGNAAAECRPSSRSGRRRMRRSRPDCASDRARSGSPSGLPWS